ncbi:hypothetical protein pipiens_015516 [Culex pipiens pipiens]|uniref:Uncharacterized protein n=1 Tax=Culex pipiens pipiens TaxID=38569 RepID=A0ABD1CQB3_CULPP
MVSFRVFLILEKIYVVLCLVVSFFEFGVFLLQFINSNGRFPETLRNFSVMLLSVVSVIACLYLSYGVSKKNIIVVKGYIWYFVVKFILYYILAMYTIYYFGRDKPDVNVNFWFISTTAVTFLINK